MPSPERSGCQNTNNTSKATHQTSTEIVRVDKIKNRKSAIRYPIVIFTLLKYYLCCVRDCGLYIRTTLEEKQMSESKKNRVNFENDAVQELMKRELIRTKTKRTIRTSFTLSPECLEIMDGMIAQRGLTYSELFDYAEVMAGAIVDINIKDSPASKFSIAKSRPKSFAINSQALNKISEKSKKRSLPRDRYVEMLMVALDEYLKNIDGLEKKVIEKFSNEISEAGGIVDEITENLSKELGDSDHPLITIMGEAGVMLMNADMAIESFLKGDGWPEFY